MATSSLSSIFALAVGDSPRNATQFESNEATSENRFAEFIM